MAVAQHTFDFVMIVPFQEKAAFGSRLLDAYLKERGYKTSILYFKRRSQEHVEPSKQEVELLLDFIEEHNPRLIGFSLLSPFRNVVFDLTDRIRERVDTPIVYGGVHATIDPDDCMLKADMACVGDGEQALDLILQRLTAGEYPTDIPNCHIREGDVVHQNEMTYMCKEMDTLPFPDLSGVGKYFIDEDEIRQEDPYLTVIRKNKKYDFKAFRGCPYNCTFCGNKAIRIAYKPVGKFLRNRSPQHVIEELKIALEHFPDLESITSYDEVFIGNKEWIQDFSKLYKREINLPLACDTYITLATEEMVDDIVNAGLTHVAVGVESFSEEIRRKLYKRRQPNADIVEGAKLFSKRGVDINYDFIADNPYETHEDLEQCFWDLIIKLPRPCGFNLYSLSHLPKADLTEQFLKEGLIQPSDVVSYSDKGLVQWKATTKFKRDPKIEFWLNMMRLYSKEIKITRKKSLHMPRFVMRFLGKRKSVRLLDRGFFCMIVVQSFFDGSFLKRVKRKTKSILGRTKNKGLSHLDFSNDPHFEH